MERVIAVGRSSSPAVSFNSEPSITIRTTSSIFSTPSAKYSFPITKELGALVAFQLSDQRSVGKELMEWSLVRHQSGRREGRRKLRRRGFYARLHQHITERRHAKPVERLSGLHQRPGAGFQSGERTSRCSRSCPTISHVSALRACPPTHFSFMAGAESTHRRSPGYADENEFNADLQWRPKWSFLNGFSARFRYSRVHQYQGPKDNQDDFRLIVNHDFP